MSTKSHTVIFLPSGRRGDLPEGTTLASAASTLGEGIEAICGGKGICGKCKVQITEGTEADIDSHPDHLLPLTDAELRHQDEHGLQANERLACQAGIRGDVAVFVPEASRVDRQVILKQAGDRVIDLIPAIRNYYIQLRTSLARQEATLGDHLSKQLASEFQLPALTIDPDALQTLGNMACGDDLGVTVTVWDSSEIIRIQPGYSDKAYGLAVDIGTTTIGAYLCDLDSGELVGTESMMNPQIRFGEDIMTRIAYANNNPDGLRQMREAVVSALNEMARAITSRAQLDPRDMVEITVVGNTVMHHIFLGLDIAPLGRWPFAPKTVRSANTKARDLGMDVLPSANVHTLPIEAGFVGADNVGVLIAEEPYNQDEMLLIVDIGTNGELILGNRDRLLSASCATGPAFEGANIKFGMRAAQGAIDRVRIDPETLDVRFSTIGNPGWNTELTPGEVQARGICGSGIIDAVAEMLAAGIVKPNGSIDKDLDSPRLRLGSDAKPEFVLAWAKETAIAQDITVTQQDVRAIQLGKAAILAGSQLLLRRLGIERPDKVILAGAFGTVIDRERALTIGMFPDCGADNTYAVGNAAGDGARIALLNKEKRVEADRIAREIEYVELTAEPGFEEAFIAATLFPHRTSTSG